LGFRPNRCSTRQSADDIEPAGGGEKTTAAGALERVEAIIEKRTRGIPYPRTQVRKKRTAQFKKLRRECRGRVKKPSLKNRGEVY